MSTSRVEGIERAIFGHVPAAEIDNWLQRLVRSQLSTALHEVLFRRGRVSAVYGLHLEDGRQVVVKVHRGSPDLRSLAAATATQRWVAEHGYPAPRPIDGPLMLDGHTAVIEALLDVGSAADAHDPVVRQALAASLAEQIRILSDMELPTALTVRPAWAVYDNGPWPTPHDPIFDFTTTPPGFEWLDDFAQQASDTLIAADLPSIVGHSDWYAGNVLVAGGVVTAAFDWDSLIIDSEAMIVGMAAGQCTSGITAFGAPTPSKVAAFLADYQAHRSTPFSPHEQRIAQGAVAWQLAYNARCELSWLGAESPAPAGSLLAALIDHRGEYL
jgi:Ser/Thr protein kinase RdoA (MazF antagonist)